LAVHHTLSVVTTFHLACEREISISLMLGCMSMLLSNFVI